MFDIFLFTTRENSWIFSPHTGIFVAHNWWRMTNVRATCTSVRHRVLLAILHRHWVAKTLSNTRSVQTGLAMAYVSQISNKHLGKFSKIGRTFKSQRAKVEKCRIQPITLNEMICSFLAQWHVKVESFSLYTRPRIVIRGGPLDIWGGVGQFFCARIFF
jgi:hypothetical protein